jgi:hypothetical protein
MKYRKGFLLMRVASIKKDFLMNNGFRSEKYSHVKIAHQGGIEK